MKNKPKVRYLLPFLSFFLLPSIISSQTQPDFDEYLGVNWQASVQTDGIECVSMVREYSRWYDSQEGVKDPNISTNDIYPNGCLMLNPVDALIPYEMDYVYGLFNDFGMQVTPAMMSTIPRYTNSTSGSGGDILNSESWIPIQWINNGGIWEEDPTDLPTMPLSYRERADWMHHYIAKYGNGNEESCEVKICDGTSGEEVNMDLIKYVESWNEPTRTWTSPSGDPAHSKFQPQEYAAMASCDYDGHGGTILGQRPDDCDSGTLETYNLGVKNVDPNIQFVMGAPHAYEWSTESSDPDCSSCPLDVWDDWVIPMRDWFAANRNDGAFIFDVLNFHQYATNDPDPTIANSKWWSPEQFEFRSKTETLIGLIDGEGWSDREVWVSEFGYDTNQGESNGWDFDLTGTNGLTPEDLQAQWNARTFLELYAAGVDRAMVHDLRNTAGLNETNADWDKHTGLLTQDGEPKKSWFYVYGMKNILQGYTYDGDFSINCDLTDNDALCASGCTRIYKFTNQANDVIWAVWSPTGCNNSYNETVSLSSGATAATGVRLGEPSVYGISETLTVVNGSVDVNVTETPIFIKESGLVAPTCASLSVDQSTCSSISLNIDIPAGQNYTGYNIWYGKTSVIAGNPDFSALNGNLTYVGYDQQANVNSITGINSVTVSGLESGTAYSIYVIPENENGIPNSYLSCFINISTSSLVDICRIPMDVESGVVSISYNNTDPNYEDNLFDEQESLDFCNSPSPEPNDPNGIDNFWIQFGSESQMEITFLQSNYIIDQFHFYDGSSSGLFIIEYSNDDGANWLPLVDYYTFALNEWITIGNLTQPSTGIEKLRLTATSDKARLKEMFICGAPVETCASSNFNLTENCNSLNVATSDTGCAVLSTLLLTGGGYTSVVNITNSPTDIEYGDLLIPKKAYNYSVITTDGSNESSFLADTIPAQIAYITGVNPLSNKGEMGCDFRTFSIHPGDPTSNKVQVWISSDGPFNMSLHPLASQPNAEMRILDVQQGGYYNNHHVRVENLNAYTTYNMAYRFVNATKSSALFFKRFKLNCLALAEPELTSFSIVNIIDDDCDVHAFMIDTNGSTGKIKFAEHQSSTSTPETGALYKKSKNTSGIPIEYLVQHPTSAQYLYIKFIINGSPIYTSSWKKNDLDNPICGGDAQANSNGETNSSYSGDIKLFPNPAKGQVTVNCNGCKSARVFTLEGKLLNSNYIAPYSRGFKINTADFSNGMYFIHVLNVDGTTNVEKFIVQH